MEKREPSWTVGGNANWYSQYGEQHGDSYKTMSKTTIWPNNSTTEHIPWENHDWKRHLYPQSSLQHYLQYLGHSSNLDVHQQMIKKKSWYIYTMGHYSNIKKNEFLSILVRWVNLESVTQSEVNQKKKKNYCILMHIYMETRKVIFINLFAGMEWRCRALWTQWGKERLAQMEKALLTCIHHHMENR